MLDRLAPLAHLLGMLVEPALDGLENVLVLPTGDPTLLARGTAVLNGAGRARVGPVAPQDQTVFLVCEAVEKLLTSRTDLDVVLRNVAEVRFDKPALHLIG